MAMCNVRFLFEFIILHSFLFILSEQVKCLSRRISEENVVASGQMNADGEINADGIQQVINFEEFRSLYVKIKENEPYYSEVKSLLRSVSNPPFKTMAFGSIEVDMTLLPNFIMFIVSYTVIALQYNNVF
ncbi:uncharacterized protein [Maniola hyperantus]|uniref:uncharacterized protein n=1 Tax=Aphantopus hyperantus TaxID=2795564 RepID=UPI0037498E63